jgi:putative membrane protein
MLRKFILSGLVVAASLCCLQLTRADDAKGDDASFVKAASAGGQMEVTLGQFAAEHAANRDVKKFGERMVTDHTQANKQLQALAEKKGLKLATQLPKKEQSMCDELMKLKGADFDRAYMKMMVTDHETDIKEFENQAKSGSDADIKAFATQTLPTLKEHLKLAKSVSDGLGQ